MKCPQCVEQRVASRVYPGMGFVTAMGVNTYHDEDGVSHRHDPNIHTTEYRCSNGHSWSAKKRKAPCPAEGCRFNLAAGASA